MAFRHTDWMSLSSLAELLTEGTAALAPLGADARREAEWLLLAASGRTRAALLANPTVPVAAADADRFRSWLERRRRGEPLAYLTGTRGFWSLELEVSPDVLVPRPETEMLVERALQLGAANCRVVDLGTGSGAIALALAHERPDWQITGVDLSPAALDVARRNATRLNLARIRWLQGDWLAPLHIERFDLILSNPPYIAADDPAMQDPALRHEPRGALTPGGDGLDALRSLARQSPAHLSPGGWLLLEHGAAQGAAVRALLVAQGFAHVRSRSDLAGHERSTEAQWLANT
jgi:release factor glutamine methyltransferase